MRQHSTPPADVVEVLEEQKDFSLFVRALNSTGLRAFLEGDEGPFTVFAPLDSAFERLPTEQLDALFRNVHRPVLKRVVRRHVVPRIVRSENLKTRQVETLGGASVPTESSTNRLAFDGGELTRGDIRASNGLLHAIDRVSLPPDLSDMLE